MKKADTPHVVLLIGNNNKINLGGKGSLPSAIVVVVSVVITIAVLVAALCCPEQLADFVRSIISIGTLIKN